MPMSLLTLVQILQIFAAYLFVSVCLPAFVLGKSLKSYRILERFLVYFMTGNFYIINLVYLLQLLKLSYPVTLALGTFIPAVLVRMALHRTPVRSSARSWLRDLKKLSSGSLGSRTLLSRFYRVLRRKLWSAGRFVWEVLKRHTFDCLLLAGFLALLSWVYGTNYMNAYGYKAFDLPVHNYWINSLEKNRIFVEGVYPYGFHCVLYYLHALFGFHTFTLLRLFGFVQTVMVHVILLFFLKLCCQSKYAAYLGTFLYVGSRYFSATTYDRFYTSLPQEFGMTFILPVVYFGFAFFVQRKRELDGQGSGKSARVWRLPWGKAKTITWRLPWTAGEDSGEREAGEKTVTWRIPWKKAGVKSVTWRLPWVIGEAEPSERQREGAIIWQLPWEKNEADAVTWRLPWKRAEAPAARETVSAAVRESGAAPAAVLEASRTAAAVLERESETVTEEALPAAVRRPWFWVRKDGERRRFQWHRSYLYLAGFAMSFSMTLTVHFYGTMIAGLFCLAMAIGYFFRFIRREYFWNVVITCLISVSIALLPMLAAFLGGTPLQNSLRWGMRIIQESQVEETVTPGEDTAQDGEGEKDASAAPKLTLGERLDNLKKEVTNRWNTVMRALNQSLNVEVFSLPDPRYADWVIYGWLILSVLGVLMCVIRRYSYGAMLLSAGLYMLFMSVLSTPQTFGLPTLIDVFRRRIYFAYSMPIAISLCADAVLVVLCLPLKRKFMLNALSLLSVCLVAGYTLSSGQIRMPYVPDVLEMNEAITCLENIVETEEDYTWTIVSTSDEVQMGEGHGYHYETISFLKDMEGVEDWSKIHIRIPTPVVYIFIEKVPLDYYPWDYPIHYEGSGQSISWEGANRPLPEIKGNEMYKGEQRWIVMSRMYYWAQAFRRMYPNEVDVYLESDQFVCYRIEQNENRLFEFAIDYGYNTQKYIAEESAHE